MSNNLLPIERLENAKYDEVLGLSSKATGAAVLVSAGYRLPEDAYAQAAMARYIKEEVIEHIRRSAIWEGSESLPPCGESVRLP